MHSAPIATVQSRCAAVILIVSIVLTCTTSVTAQSSNSSSSNSSSPSSPWPRVGGLPVLFPPPLPVACSPFNDDCTGCTSTPGCGFCYESIVHSVGSVPTLTGKCTPMIDNAQACNGKRLYVQGQCDGALNRPGCTMRVDGTCQLDYVYDMKYSRQQRIDVAFAMYVVLVLLFTLVLFYFCYWTERNVPYYGKHLASSFVTRIAPIKDTRIAAQVWFRLACAILSVIQILVDKWSAIQPPSRSADLQYGLTGYWSSAWSKKSWYRCSDTTTFRNPDSNVDPCNLLALATVTVGLMQVVACIGFLIAGLKFIHVLCGQNNNNNPKHPHDTRWWRLDFVCLVCSAFSTFLWCGVCHGLIQETLTLPGNGDFHFTLELTHSFKMCACVTGFSLLVVVVTAIDVSLMEGGHGQPTDKQCPCWKRVERVKIQEVKEEPIEMAVIVQNSNMTTIVVAPVATSYGGAATPLPSPSTIADTDAILPDERPNREEQERKQREEEQLTAEHQLAEELAAKKNAEVNAQLIFPASTLAASSSSSFASTTAALPPSSFDPSVAPPSYETVAAASNPSQQQQQQQQQWQQDEPTLVQLPPVVQPPQ